MVGDSYLSSELLARHRKKNHSSRTAQAKSSQDPIPKKNKLKG
jgi:hypothetical protein